MGDIKAAGAAKAEPSQDIPIFLRKTYHMIDSCDPTIACWSEDGETFVVKDPVKFERIIIPQFFKHSKFSSFVRQLNFYAFRKIKYADTLRIDPKLEAETANYWRFRHDKFRKGKPELLSEIKRMNGQKTTKTKANNGGKDNQDPDALKTELNTLKKRIEDMSKNMDELTSLVKKVSISKDEDPNNSFEVGTKRKKLDCELPDPYAAIRPDELISSMDFDEEFNVAGVPPMPPPELNPREDEEGGTNNMSDDDFVDQLFTAFTEDANDFHVEVEPEDVVSAPLLPSLPAPQKVAPSPPTSPLPSPRLSAISAPMSPPASPRLSAVGPKKVSSLSLSSPQSPDSRAKNTPEPELMSRLSEALSILPREMQELIVDRLVTSIMSTDSVEKTLSAVTTLNDLGVGSDVVPAVKALPNATPSLTPVSVQDEPNGSKSASDVPLGMPLAAATLAALLSHYSSQVKAQNVQKTLPVIPVHA